MAEELFRCGDPNSIDLCEGFLENDRGLLYDFCISMSTFLMENESTHYDLIHVQGDDKKVFTLTPWGIERLVCLRYLYSADGVFGRGPGRTAPRQA